MRPKSLAVKWIDIKKPLEQISITAACLNIKWNNIQDLLMQLI